MKTKESISSRLRPLEQIHPDMKQEQLPSGAVPAYSLSGAFPSWRVCSHILLCAAFPLFWLCFWDWGPGNLLIFSRKEQNEQMQITERGEGGLASPVTACPLASTSRAQQPPAPRLVGLCHQQSHRGAATAAPCCTAPGHRGAEVRGRDAAVCFSAASASDLWLRRAHSWLREGTKIGCADRPAFGGSSDSGSMEIGLPTIYHAAFN